MRLSFFIKVLFLPVALLALASLLSACTPTQSACASPQSRNLDKAIGEVRHSLSNGCEASFSRYMEDLLLIAEGDPSPDNKRSFSDFLLWSADEGLLSKRQAQNIYNRYFNVKFVALQGDYNNCSSTCPRISHVLAEMEAELNDKERGLLRVALDNQGYYRADQLLKETELVLEATCIACEAGNR